MVNSIETLPFSIEPPEESRQKVIRSEEQGGIWLSGGPLAESSNNNPEPPRT